MYRIYSVIVQVSVLIAFLWTSDICLCVHDRVGGVYYKVDLFYFRAITVRNTIFRIAKPRTVVSVRPKLMRAETRIQKFVILI